MSSTNTGKVQMRHLQLNILRGRKRQGCLRDQRLTEGLASPDVWESGLKENANISVLYRVPYILLISVE